MNETIKQKVENFAQEYSVLKSLINILDNIMCDNCDFCDADIMNLCSLINKISKSCTINLSEIEIELKI